MHVIRSSGKVVYTTCRVDCVWFFLVSSEQADGVRPVNKEELQTLVHEHRRATRINIGQGCQDGSLGFRNSAMRESSLEHPAGGVGSLL